MSSVDSMPSSLKQEYDRLNRALRLAVAANHALMQSTGEHQLFQSVCNIVVEVGGYRMAWIGYVEHDVAKSIRPVAHAGSDAEYLKTTNLTWEDNERGRGPGGLAVRTRQFVISRNISTDLTFQPWREEALQRGFASVIALPLETEGQVVAVLGIYSGALDAFDAQEVEVLQQLAHRLGFGLTVERARHKQAIAEGRASELGVALEAAIVDSINNEILFRSIYENAPMGIIRFDSNWKFLSVNSAYAQMVGYSESELLSMTIMDVTHPEDRQVTVDSRAKLGADLKILKGFEKRYITKSGKVIWARISGTKFKIEGQQAPNVLATVEDVTDRRELEFKLELETRKALQSAKLASLGEMSAGIAHEINNPITVVLGSLEILERDRLAPEKFQKSIRAIRQAGEKIAHIASGLTRFSRRSEYSHKAPKVLAEIVEYMAEIIGPMAKISATAIELELESSARIVCNEIEIAQVIQNLLANGIDAVKEAPEKWVRVKVSEAERQVILQVIDSGSGIPAGLEEKIFEPFFTTKPAGSGTGLGLSIVRGIVTEHEGSLELMQIDGHTCFELRFSVDDREIPPR